MTCWYRVTPMDGDKAGTSFDVFVADGRVVSSSFGLVGTGVVWRERRTEYEEWGWNICELGGEP